MKRRADLPNSTASIMIALETPMPFVWYTVLALHQLLSSTCTSCCLRLAPVVVFDLQVGALLDLCLECTVSRSTLQSSASGLLTFGLILA